MRFSSPVSLIPTLAFLLLSTRVVKVTALPSPLLGPVDDPVPLPALPALPLDLPTPKIHCRASTRRIATRESPRADMRASRRVGRSALDFAQPVKVPMPLLKPREVDTQQGEKDENLEDRKKCSEDTMHDCYVSRSLLDGLLDDIPVADTLLQPKGVRMVVRRR